MLRGMRPLTSSFANKMEENSSASEHVLRMSGYFNHLNQVGVNLLDKRVIGKSSLVTVTKLLELRDELLYAMDDDNNSRDLRDAEIGDGRNQERASSVDG